MRTLLKKQYTRTMRNAYAFARTAASVQRGAFVLDCGSGSGHERAETFGLHSSNEAQINYCGLEWSRNAVESGQAAGFDIVEADLNRPLPVDSKSQDCVIAFSVLEHLLMPCSFVTECHRVLKRGGKLVILTPNISTYFTALQILLGKMPSSGPHPDSNRLLQLDETIKVSDIERDDVTSDTPQHRHLVVFSFRALKEFLRMTGFQIEMAKGFGYYPLPIWMQPFFERLDTGHCHQRVFVCKKIQLGANECD